LPGGSNDLTAASAEACAAGASPFPMARIVDISDEVKRNLASKLILDERSNPLINRMHDGLDEPHSTKVEYPLHWSVVRIGAER
jgi:hypothetical protein